MANEAALLLLLAGCSAGPAGAPDVTQAIDSACERAASCVEEADAGLPVSPSFCESEAREIVKGDTQTCDQATLDACAEANRVADCDTARANATKPGGACASCWVSSDGGAR